MNNKWKWLMAGSITLMVLSGGWLVNNIVDLIKEKQPVVTDKLADTTNTPIDPVLLDVVENNESKPMRAALSSGHSDDREFEVDAPLLAWLDSNYNVFAVPKNSGDTIQIEISKTAERAISLGLPIDSIIEVRSDHKAISLRFVSRQLPDSSIALMPYLVVTRDTLENFTGDSTINILDAMWVIRDRISPYSQYLFGTQD